ncbi:hypothetical protein N9J52_03510 [Flavobacteriales bacterium]|nr:hypothetical protein [Flavobacteriales bacterium]
MRVHLISESENEMEFVEDVLNILNRASGPIKFISGVGYELVEPQDFMSIDREEYHPDAEESANLEGDDDWMIPQEVPRSSPIIRYSLSTSESKLKSNRDFFQVEKEKKTWDDFKSFVEAHRENLDEKDAEAWEKLPIPEESEMANWETFFNFCRVYRGQYDVGDDEHVLLLTPLYNDKNWFAASDKHARNHFVHIADWSYFLGEGIDARYPVAYEVMITVLHKLVSEKHGFELRQLVHMKPKGCVSDFCADKTEIMLKMRTADICPSCIGKLDESGIDKSSVKQVLQVLDNIRSAMTFRSRAEYFQTPSRLEVRGHMCKLFLTDLGNLEVRLTPRQRAIYMVYLNHPNGITVPELPDHREEIASYYGRFANVGDQEDIDMALENLLDIFSGTLSTELSRIRSAFRKAAGNEMAKHYTIDGASGNPKSILLDRALVLSE